MSRVGKAIATLCCAASLACRSQVKTAGLEPGAELYSVTPASVREVLVSSPTRKVYAYRWKPDQPFQVVIASTESAMAEQCSGGPGFERLLQALATASVLKESEKHFEDGTAAWVDVRLRDTTNLEPIDARIRIPEAEAESVVIQFGDRQYVLHVDGAALQLAKSGCSTLGQAK